MLALAPREREILLEALVLLGGIRLGLWLFSFQAVKRFLAKKAVIVANTRQAEKECIDRVVWAVGVASRCVPHATCLTQALAVQALLARRGYPASLRIGVARSDEGSFEAHAWVENQGRIVVGNLADLPRYTPLPPL